MTARGEVGHRFFRQRTKKNLLDDGVVDCARSIVNRAAKYGNWVEVYVDNRGDVHLNRVDKPATHEPPAAWLVGVYNGLSFVRRVAQDLEERLREIDGVEP